MNSRKIRIGVSGHDLKFWYPLQRMLEDTGRFEFKEDLWIGHEGHDPADAKALIEWADVLVAEWALGNAVYYAKHKKAGQKLVVRLHLQERNTLFPEQIDYARVDRVVFVGAHIMRECISKFGIPPEKCEVIGNFVDARSYGLEKLGDAAFTLGIIGTAPMRKRLDLAVETLALLQQRDKRYTLRVKGNSPASFRWVWDQQDQVDYYENIYASINSGALRHKVIFDPHGADVHHWLRMTGFILSPSDFESFHMAVAEGAASGSIPVLWNWEGASEIYPEFEVVRTPQDAADMIEYFGRSAAGPRYRAQVKNVIDTRYDAPVIGARWEELLASEADAPARGVGRSMRRGRLPLVVWAIDNWQTFHRREMLEALARNVADAYDLVVIEPGNHFLAIEQLGWAGRSDLQRIAAGELLQESENIFRTRLINDGAPAGTQLRWAAKDPLIVLDKLLAEHYGAEVAAIHWVYKPDQAERLGGQRRFIYEAYDDYTFDFGTGEVLTTVLQQEQKIMPMAEHVFFTSQPLQDRKQTFAKAWSLVGNGVDCAAFTRFQLEHPGADAPGRRVVGYLGNLSDFFDWELMLAVCQGLPELDFVFHGQVEEAKLGPKLDLYKTMQALPNTRFTGRVGRPLGAAALNRYDVLTIPFVENDAMDAVNPLKLWEYFAIGKPVVSSPMTAIEDKHELVRFASGAEAWIGAIRDALQEEVGGVRERARIETAGRMDWSVLTEVHAGVLRRAFEAARAA